MGALVQPDYKMIRGLAAVVATARRNRLVFSVMNGTGQTKLMGLDRFPASSLGWCRSRRDRTLSCVRASWKIAARLPREETYKSFR